ncbi:MAG TPA: hypothetical protein VI386_23935 [Candidatus Sulfotelmatobacter sp.]
MNFLTGQGVSPKQIPIDFAHLRLIFRGVAGDHTWLPQQWGMPSEKHSQQDERQREPNGQPDQRAAEDLFGAPSITQGPEQEGKKQAYQAVAEIECNTFERKDCPPAPVRFEKGVQIIREEKANRDHGGTKRESEYHTPPAPVQEGPSA